MPKIDELTVEITAKDMTLQQAAAIIQTEFAKKSDWYGALVASISSALKELPADVILCDVAEKIADRLIGE